MLYATSVSSTKHPGRAGTTHEALNGVVVSTSVPGGTTLMSPVCSDATTVCPREATSAVRLGATHSAPPSPTAATFPTAVTESIVTGDASVSVKATAAQRSAVFPRNVERRMAMGWSVPPVIGSLERTSTAPPACPGPAELPSKRESSITCSRRADDG